jgi:hypothetical protein
VQDRPGHARDGAATGAERVDVETRQRHLGDVHAALARQLRLALLEQGDIRARATHVERDQVALADQRRAVAACRDAARGPREHRASGEARRFRHRRDAAVRLHDQHFAAIARRRELVAEAHEVPREHGADIGVDDRRPDPLVLLDLRQHLRRERHIRVGQALRERLTRELLVCTVLVRVQVTDGDGVDLRLAQAPDALHERALAERRGHRAVEAHALAHADPPGARHEGHGRWHAHVVPVILQALAHLDDVAVTLGGQQAHSRPLALEQRVGGGGGPVHDALRLREQAGTISAERLREQREAIEEALGGVGGRGRALGDDDAPVLVDRRQIREGATDIDADPVHGPPVSQRRRRFSRRGHDFELTNPFSTSAARAAGSRLDGGP